MKLFFLLDTHQDPEKISAGKIFAGKIFAGKISAENISGFDQKWQNQDLIF